MSRRLTRPGPASVVVLLACCATSGSQPRRSEEAVRILVDEGHHNYHRVDGTLAKLVEILANSGYEIVPLRGLVTAGALSLFDIFLSGNPFPAPREELVRSAMDAGEPFRFHAAASRPAFEETEAHALAEWVRNGNSALLLADHAPHGITMRPLAQVFGVELRNVETSDPSHAPPARPGWILFTRADAMIGDHAITRGVDSVVTTLGQSIQGPAGSSSLLNLAATAIDAHWDPTARTRIERSAAGRSQGVALEVGRGRVVVMGEAGFLVAGVDSGTGEPILPGPGNLRLALNIIQWLSPPALRSELRRDR